MATKIRSPRECGRVTAAWLSTLTVNQRTTFLRSLSSRELSELETLWSFWARDEQLAPTHVDW